MAKAEPKRTRADIEAKRDAILSDWEDCWPADEIGRRNSCTDSNVYRVVRAYGPHPDQSARNEQGCEMKRAEIFKDSVVKMYNAGKSVDHIAKTLGLETREVRAAVYLAIQAGEVPSYLPSEPSR